MNYLPVHTRTLHKFIHSLTLASPLGDYMSVGAAGTVSANDTLAALTLPRGGVTRVPEAAIRVTVTGSTADTGL